MATTLPVMTSDTSICSPHGGAACGGRPRGQPAGAACGPRVSFACANPMLPAAQPQTLELSYDVWWRSRPDAGHQAVGVVAGDLDVVGRHRQQPDGGVEALEHAAVPELAEEIGRAHV